MHEYRLICTLWPIYYTMNTLTCSARVAGDLGTRETGWARLPAPQLQVWTLSLLAVAIYHAHRDTALSTASVCPSISVALLDCHVRSFLVYDLAGIGATPKPYLGLKASASQSPCSSVSRLGVICMSSEKVHACVILFCADSSSRLRLTNRRSLTPGSQSASRTAWYVSSIKRLTLSQYCFTFPIN